MRYLNLLFVPLLVWACGGPTEPDPDNISKVTIKPEEATREPGQVVRFEVNVYCDRSSSCNREHNVSARQGSVTQEGRYTAPDQFGVDTVAATSVADPLKKAVATVGVFGEPEMSWFVESNKYVDSDFQSNRLVLGNIEVHWYSTSGELEKKVNPSFSGGVDALSVASSEDVLVAGRSQKGTFVARVSREGISQKITCEPVRVQDVTVDDDRLFLLIKESRENGRTGFAMLQAPASDLSGVCGNEVQFPKLERTSISSGYTATGLGVVDGDVYIAGDHYQRDDDNFGFIRKYSISGELVWEKSFSELSGTSLAFVEAGTSSFYVAGSIYKDPHRERRGFRFWVQRLDLSGTLLWEEPVTWNGGDDRSPSETNNRMGNLVGDVVVGERGEAVLVGGLAKLQNREWDEPERMDCGLLAVSSDGSPVWSHRQKVQSDSDFQCEGAEISQNALYAFGNSGTQSNEDLSGIVKFSIP